MKSWLAQGSSGRRVTLLPGTTFLHINGALIALRPMRLHTQINFPTALITLVIKVFGPVFFLRMLYLFKVRKLGAFLAHGREYRRMGLVYFVTSSQCLIHKRNKHKQREIAFFFNRISEYSFIVFPCNNKSDSENGRALHRIPSFNDHRPESEKRRKTKDRFCNLSLFML